MTKLEELKAAYDAAFFACDAALADANDASDAAYAARDDAWSAYHAELKKEQTNEL